MDTQVLITLLRKYTELIEKLDTMKLDFLTMAELNPVHSGNNSLLNGKTDIFIDVTDWIRKRLEMSKDLLIEDTFVTKSASAINKLRKTCRKNYLKLNRSKLKISKPTLNFGNIKTNSPMRNYLVNTKFNSNSLFQKSYGKNSQNKDLFSNEKVQMNNVSIEKIREFQTPLFVSKELNKFEVESMKPCDEFAYPKFRFAGSDASDKADKNSLFCFSEKEKAIELEEFNYWGTLIEAEKESGRTNQFVANKKDFSSESQYSENNKRQK